MRVAAVAILVACKGESTDAGPPSAAPDAGVDASPDATTDAGTGESAPAPLATSPGKDEDPSLVRAKDGSFVLAWYSNRDGRDDLWMKTSPDGRAWSADRAITSDDAHDFYPSLVQTNDGRFHLVWWRGSLSDAGAIAGSIWTMSSSDLVTWTAPLALTDASAFAWAPTIAERAPGELVVAWASDASGDKDVWTRTSKDGGATWSPPARITDAAFNDDLPFVASRGDGSLVLSWQRYDVRAKGFDAPFGDTSNELVYARSTDGVTWSSPVAITSDPAGQPIFDGMGGLFASDDPSGWSAAWTSTRAPGAQAGDVFAAGLSAAPVSSSTVRALTSGSGRDYSPRLAPTGTAGLYLMVWVSDGGGSNLDVYQRFVRPSG